MAFGMNTEITFGEWLKRRRRTLDLTQKELANQVGYSVGTIRKIEANDRRPSKQFASILADRLGITKEQIDAFVIFARTDPFSSDLTPLPPDFFNKGSEEVPLPHPLEDKQLMVVNTLPPQVTRFIGRKAELATLDRLLSDPAVRLVSIVGPGGIGKTRLAIESAAQQIRHLAHGVHFVSLAPLDSAGQLVQALTEAMKLSFSSDDDLKAHIFRYLKTKQMLLLMDNFEHLLAGARLLNEILEAAPGVTLLVTSREKLNLTTETVFNVAGLDHDDWQKPADTMSQDAAQLFVQSAQRTRPEFEIRQEDVKLVSEICRMVEGMPLAILLAAAWVDLLSPGEIAAEIGVSLDFLDTELRDLPARQRSLRAVFETSWDRLTQDERELFKKLSVFRGGLTREAARQVAGATLRELAGLVNKSFLRRDHDTGRYEVHELLRQYAEERLDLNAEVTNAAHEAHAAFFAKFMEKMSQELRSDRQKVKLDEIESDIENIRAGWRYLTAQGNSAEIAKIVDSLWYFHEIRGWYHAAVDLFVEAEKTLMANADDNDTAAVAFQLMGAKAWYMSLLGQVQQSKKMAKESVVSLQRIDRQQEQLIPLQGLAMSYFFLQQIPDLIETAHETLDIARKLGNKWWEAAALSWIGHAYVAALAFDDAENYAEAAAKILGKSGDPWLSYFPSQALAQVATLLGVYIVAKERFQLALEAALSINFKRGMAYTYSNLGGVSYLLEEYVEAEGYHLQSLRIGQEISQMREMLGDIYGIARVWAVLGRGSETIELLAVVLQHPASEQRFLITPSTIKHDAEQLRGKLEAELPAEEYALGWQRGTAIELETVVAKLLV